MYKFICKNFTYVFILGVIIFTPACFIEKNKKDEKIVEVGVSDKSKLVTGESDKVRDYYSKWAGEEKRLFEKPSGIIERLRTESILRRNLPKAPAVIYDIGGGAGVYAFELAKQGYTVHLFDYTPLHIEQAKKRMQESRVKLAECSVGDARDVKAKDGVADVVLLFGPLYHLLEKKDRDKALSEAYRILKPGGMLFAAGCSRFVTFIRFGEDPKFHKGFEFESIGEVLKTGKFTNSKGVERQYWTDAYFHKPEELENELKESGFKETKLFVIEGLSWAFPLKKEIVENKKLLEKLLHFLEIIENEKSFIGTGSHIMAIGRK